MVYTSPESLKYIKGKDKDINTKEMKEMEAQFEKIPKKTKQTELVWYTDMSEKTSRVFMYMYTFVQNWLLQGGKLINLFDLNCKINLGKQGLG